MNYLCSRAGLHSTGATQADCREHKWHQMTCNGDVLEDSSTRPPKTPRSPFDTLPRRASPPSSFTGLLGPGQVRASCMPIGQRVDAAAGTCRPGRWKPSATFELGSYAAFDVRVLEADEVDEAKYYYPYGDLSKDLSSAAASNGPTTDDGDSAIPPGRRW